MTEITQLLQAAGQGDRAAADQVVAELYGELQRLARQRIRAAGEMTLLDTTALANGPSSSVPISDGYHNDSDGTCAANG